MKSNLCEVATDQNCILEVPLGLRTEVGYLEKPVTLEGTAGAVVTIMKEMVLNGSSGAVETELRETKVVSQIVGVRCRTLEEHLMWQGLVCGHRQRCKLSSEDGGLLLANPKLPGKNNTENFL